MPRTPTSLQAQAEERANQDHSRRLAEIKAMAPLLARLDAFVPALKDQGLTVYVDGVRLYTQDRHGKRERLLRIDTCGVLDSRQPARWLHALLELGFTEVRRSEPPVPQVTLRHGHLRVIIDAPETAAQKAASAAVYAQRAAAAMAAEANLGLPA